MRYEDEKDYIMRILKEAVRVLFSVLLCKPYTQVELERMNKYAVSGSALDDYKSMVDQGNINEAENQLLDEIDYTDKDDVAAAILFYQYIGEKGSEFLQAHDYSMEEVIDGIRRVAGQSGCDSILKELILDL